ncbi:MAG: hypothetical protein AAF211_04945 [Myxococcota bacterium]
MLLVLLATACGIDLPSEGILDRTRILAARAEPAQPAAGETFTVTSYAYAPSGPPTVVWCSPFADCDPRDPLVAELAELDWAALPEEAQASRRSEALMAGILGTEPGMPVEAVAAPLPTGDLVLLAYGVPPEGDDIEEATLTLELAGGAPNGHPTLEAVRLDDAAVAEIAIGVEETVVLDVALTEDSRETYVDDEGNTLEELTSVRWYTDVAALEDLGFGSTGPGPAGLDDGTLELVAESAVDGIVVVVVRDGRGGADWRELGLTVE